jgi:hypothetical protein
MKLFRNNLFLASALMLALPWTGIFAMDVASCSYNLRSKDVMSGDLTQKIISILKNSFTQENITALESNNVVSEEMLSYLKKAIQSIPAALEEGDKFFIQTLGYQEDLKKKLHESLKDFSDKYISNIKASTKNDSINNLHRAREFIDLSQEKLLMLKTALQIESQGKIELLQIVLQEILQALYQKEIDNISKKIEQVKKRLPKDPTKESSARNELNTHQTKINELKAKPTDQNEQTTFAKKLPTLIQELEESIDKKKRHYNREFKNLIDLGITNEDTKKLNGLGIKNSDLYSVEMNNQAKPNSLIVNIRGKLYELEAALAAKNHGKNILEFGKKIHFYFKKDFLGEEIEKHREVKGINDPHNKFLKPTEAGENKEYLIITQEFDIVTGNSIKNRIEAGEIIECKTTNYDVSQYIINLKQQQFLSQHAEKAEFIVEGESHKGPRKKTSDIQCFINKPIVCYVKYMDSHSKCLSNKTDLLQEDLIKLGFTLWDGETYHHALKITDPYSDMLDAKEILALKKQILSIGQDRFILHIIAPNKHHKRICEILNVFGISSPQEILSTKRDRSNSNPSQLTTPFKSSHNTRSASEKNNLTKLFSSLFSADGITDGCIRTPVPVKNFVLINLEEDSSHDEETSIESEISTLISPIDKEKTRKRLACTNLTPLLESLVFKSELPDTDEEIIKKAKAVSVAISLGLQSPQKSNHRVQNTIIQPRHSPSPKGGTKRPVPYNTDSVCRKLEFGDKDKE